MPPGAVVAFLCDSGARYKCRDLLTYLLTLVQLHERDWWRSKEQLLSHHTVGYVAYLLTIGLLVIWSSNLYCIMRSTHIAHAIPGNVRDFDRTAEWPA